MLELSTFWYHMGNAEVIPANQGISSITWSGLIEKGCMVFISHFSITLMNHALIDCRSRSRKILLRKLNMWKNIARNGMIVSWSKWKTWYFHIMVISRKKYREYVSFLATKHLLDVVIKAVLSKMTNDASLCPNHFHEATC